MTTRADLQTTLETLPDEVATLYSTYLAGEIRLLTTTYGLLPGVPFDNMQRRIQDVVDLGSGQPVWAMLCAQGLPYTRVTVIDFRRSLLVYMQHLLQEQGAKTVTIAQASSLTHLPLANQTADLIHAHCPSRALHHAEWETLLRECWRVLRPGGCLYVLEMGLGEPVAGRSPATRRLWDLVQGAAAQVGRRAYRAEQLENWQQLTGDMLDRAGFSARSSAHWQVTHGPGATHRHWNEAVLALLWCDWLPLMEQTGRWSRQELRSLWAEVRQEMEHPAFHGFLPLATFWGIKTSKGS